MVLHVLRLRHVMSLLVLATLAALSVSVPAGAVASSSSVSNSTNYGVSEVQFGSGGELHACGTAYCAKQSAGDLTVGNTKGTLFQAQAGLTTDRTPFLAVSVTGTSISLGDLTTTTTGSGSSPFTVSAYLTSGYDVYIDGTSPRTSGGAILAPMSTMTTSQQGVEQFGINLRQNTVPAVGADVVQVPSSTFGFGAPATGYGTVNSYKYVAGDVIASSTSSSSETDYTLSAIANSAPSTKAGQYKGRLVINVIPTF